MRVGELYTAYMRSSRRSYLYFLLTVLRIDHSTATAQRYWLLVLRPDTPVLLTSSHVVM